MRSPARRASANALPALCELGESEFGDGEERQCDERGGVDEGSSASQSKVPPEGLVDGKDMPARCATGRDAVH